MSTSLELVVARYAEDLRWLRRVPDAFRITVYDKGGDLPDAIRLPNVGYEAHTYLHHLITRRDDLAETTVFVQGHPFDHVPRLHRRLRRLADGEDRVEDFRWMGFVVDHDDAGGERLFRPWSKNRDGRGLDMPGFHARLFGDPGPERYVFYPGAQFCLTAACARNRPLDFYRRAIALAESFPDGGHCFERVWDRVFGVDGYPDVLRGVEPPVYFRPVRRLGLGWDDIPEAWRDLD